jgi:hypothetical protein
MDFGESVRIDENSGKFWPFRYCSAQSGSPMRASDSSVGDVAGQFHTTRSAAAMVFTGDPSEYVSRSLCDALVAAKGGLSP